MSDAIVCSCGYAFRLDDLAAAGATITCPICSRQVTAAPAGAHELGYGVPGATGTMVTPRTVEMLRQTTLWVRIMSVLMFVGAGFMVLGSLVMIAIAVITAKKESIPMAGLGAVYIVLSLLYIMPAFYLWRYATHSKAFAQFRQEQRLEQAMEAQKSFWKFVAITALIMLGLYFLVLIPGAILMAIFNH